MQATNFNGGVTFFAHELSIKRLHGIKLWRDKLSAASPFLSENYPHVLDIGASLIAMTDRITFDLDDSAHPALVEFQSFWEAFTKAKEDDKPAIVASFLEDGSLAVRQAWNNAIDAAQVQVDATTKPPEMLTEDEKNDDFLDKSDESNEK